MEEKLQFAVLIDAENISSKYAAVIFDELEKYGFASCRRIYGNWSRGSGWKEELLLEYSIIPIQQFSYTTGKNCTDMAMVIDAMDLLYQNKVDGFCLVTSDSDFTRLAMRLREEKKYVLGMGESKTPLALTRACNKFIHLNLIDESGKELSNGVPARNREEENLENVTSIEHVENAILGMLNESGEEILELSFIGQRLSEKFPDFDVRKEGQIPREQIEQEVIAIIRKNGGSVDNLSMIHADLKSRYSGFDSKDYGYSRISGFLRSMEGLVVKDNSVKLKKQKKK